MFRVGLSIINIHNLENSQTVNENHCDSILGSFNHAVNEERPLFTIRIMYV